MNTYRIADLTVAMEAGGRTARQAEPYRVENAPADITIRAEESVNHQLYPNLSEDDCEYMTTGGIFYSRLLDYEGMMLHASCVVVDGKAYLFSAPCGTGKSTHTQYWLQLFGDRAYILNDDKPALRFTDGRWCVYGTPWSGKTAQNRNAKVPLGGIGILRRGTENHTRRMGGAEAVFSLLDQTLRPKLEQRAKTLMTLIGKLVEAGVIYEVTANMSLQAAEVAYAAMNNEEQK